MKLLTMATVCLLPGVLLAEPYSGQVIGWGNNIAGQSTGASTSHFFTNRGAVDIANTCATGAVVIAGQNLTNAVAISTGMYHSVALRDDGTVVGFGDNYFGKAIGSTNEYPYRGSAQVRIGGRILGNVISVAADQDFSLALKANGTVVTWGENHIPANLTNIAAIAAEEGCSWALKRNGTVVGWRSQQSDPAYGPLMTVEGLSNVIAIAVGPGGYHTRGIALRSDGTVANWGGESDYKDATPPVGLSNVVAIAAGDDHTLALTRDGTVTGWGFNNVGQATGSPTTNAPYISAGQVKFGDEVLSNVVSIAANRGYSLALKKDGTVVSWGRMVNDLYPATVPAGLSNVVAIAAGESFCLAITTNSTVADRFRKSTR
jgi:alpha-tubulin suppressor-like RCC1 family protein